MGQRVVEGSCDVSVDLAGFRIENPTILASGILGTSLGTLEKIVEAGAGAVVCKSLSLETRMGYNNPTLVEVEGGYLNAIGLSNPGAKEFLSELSTSGNVKIPLIASIFASSIEEFGQLASLLNVEHVKAFELNLSCPHVAGVGKEVGSDPALVFKIVRKVRSSTSKPIFAKLAPEVPDIMEVAKAAVRAGADTITAINTVRGTSIDIETGRPVLSNVIGGLSGPALKPIALGCVYELAKKIRCPIIGSGGVTNWTDALEFLLAGASAVQIGTGIAYRGINIFREVSDGIKGYMKRKNIRTIGEIVGRACA